MPLDEEALAGKEVRLFVSHNIKSDREAELRATASFLAIARAVSEFGRAVVSFAGGPRGKLRCYAEVSFKVKDDATSHEERPDGILHVTRGKTNWTAMVEAKVGNNTLEQEQFTRYHTLARDQGFQAFITLSNQSALPNGLPPRIRVDKRRLKSVPVVHLSWERLLSEAQLLSRREGVADSDQQWMLDEWIRYVADPQSRIIEPPQMGEHWNHILQAAREGNLSACKKQMYDTVQRWHAFLHKVALRLRAKLGVDVVLKISRAERNDPEMRIRKLQTNAIQDGELSGVFRIPDAAGDLSVVILLAAKSVRYAIDVEAPTEGRPRTRVKWLLKQLMSQEVPDDLVIKVHWDNRRDWSQGRLQDLRQDVDSLLREVPPQALPRSFTLERTVGLPKGKGRSSAPVLEGIAQGVVDFYKRVVEGIRPFVPRAPQLPKEKPEPEAETEIEVQVVPRKSDAVAPPTRADPLPNPADTVSAEP